MTYQEEVDDLPEAPKVVDSEEMELDFLETTAGAFPEEEVLEPAPPTGSPAFSGSGFSVSGCSFDFVCIRCRHRS